jgi:hypothetical protein
MGLEDNVSAMANGEHVKVAEEATMGAAEIEDNGEDSNLKDELSGLLVKIFLLQQSLMN